MPIWETGQWWLYTFSTPDYSDDTARLVVASTSEEDGTAYMLAISSLTEARRHAVLNHNPFLGRINHSDLGAFENGASQQVLSFPLEEELLVVHIVLYGMECFRIRCLRKYCRGHCELGRRF